MRPTILFAAVFVLARVSWARASDDVSSGAMSLGRVLAIAERASPEILAARRRWRAAESRILQAATPEQPRLDLERMYAPPGADPASRAQERSLAVSQELPFPSSLYLKGSRAALAARAAEQEYLSKLREVLARTRSAYAELFLAEKSLAIFDEHIELMRRFAKVAESKYAAGHASQSDALKAQVELTKMLNRNVTLLQEKEIARAMLNALLGREAREPLGTPADPEPVTLDGRLEELNAAALSRRPELRRAVLEAEAAGKSLSLARSEYLPDLMFLYRSRSDPMRGRSQDAVLGVSLPLWFWRPAAMVSEAEAEKEAAEAEAEAARVMTSAELQSAWVRTRTARRLTEIYKTSVLPQAEAALKVAEAGYQAEKSSFLDLLDAQRSLLDFRLEHYQYMAEYERRLAELERIAGEEL